MADMRDAQAPTGGLAARSRGGLVGDFLAGAGFLGRGIGMYSRGPRLMVLGLLPALISAVVLVAAFVAAVFLVDDVVVLITPFADDWSTAARTTTRTVAGVAIVGGWILLSLLLYTALTLTIGQPFYEAISKNIEDRYGGVPGEIDVSFWRTLPRSLADSVRMLAFTAVFGVPLFLGGFIPIVGETVVPVLGAALGGWVLALELTSVPFERRGLRLRDRRRTLRGRRGMALGFGMATFVCFLIPFGAVLLMPAAVAGATLLSRRLLETPPSAPPLPPV